METHKAIVDIAKIKKNVAARFLYRRGYEIIATEAGDDSGCIDVVAAKDGTVAFVRVTCGAEEGGGPDHRERERAARAFLARPLHGSFIGGYSISDAYSFSALRFDDLDVSLIENPLRPSEGLIFIRHCTDVTGGR